MGASVYPVFVYPHLCFTHAPPVSFCFQLLSSLGVFSFFYPLALSTYSSYPTVFCCIYHISASVLQQVSEYSLAARFISKLICSMYYGKYNLITDLYCVILIHSYFSCHFSWLFYQNKIKNHERYKKHGYKKHHPNIQFHLCLRPPLTLVLTPSQPQKIKLLFNKLNLGKFEN